VTQSFLDIDTKHFKPEKWTKAEERKKPLSYVRIAKVCHPAPNYVEHIKRKEGYKLGESAKHCFSFSKHMGAEIQKTSITISACEGAGMFYGVTTLLQAIKGNAAKDKALSVDDVPRPNCVSKMTIDDFPRFNYRGFMLDSVRHFQVLVGYGHSLNQKIRLCVHTIGNHIRKHEKIIGK
jgi:hypothetical protein